MTNDPMEATSLPGWAQAVVQAGTTDVEAVRQLYGQRINAERFEVVMNTNHHLSKPVMIGKANSSDL
jgi:urea transport system substrate-binding protein